MTNAPLQVPDALVARINALGFSLEISYDVNFATPKGAPVTTLVRPWGRQMVFNLGTLESMISGCESEAALFGSEER